MTRDRVLPKAARERWLKPPPEPEPKAHKATPPGALWVAPVMLDGSLLPAEPVVFEERDRNMMVNTEDITWEVPHDLTIDQLIIFKEEPTQFEDGLAEPGALYTIRLDRAYSLQQADRFMVEKENLRLGGETFWIQGLLSRK
jgi:hypothetical protein